MSKQDILHLSDKFKLNPFIIEFWYEQSWLESMQDLEDFFEENIEIIKAQPFVKWVGWKRQLISQFEKLFPTDFNNYFEPFLWAGAVFFNLQKEKSFLSDVNEELINSYQVIKGNPSELIQLLKTFEYSKDFFLEIKFWDRVG